MKNEILARDVGDWDAELTVLAGPNAPSTSTGRMRARLVAGGWLVMDFENLSTGFSGHGIYGWDAAAGHFVGTWVDDMSSTLRIMKGAHDPATGAVTYVDRAVGPQGEVEMRQRTTAPEPDIRHFSSAVVMPDGNEMEVVRAIYRRSPRSGSPS